MATIGLIGAGHIGSQIARLAVANGYNVVISNSRGPQTLSALVNELGAKAKAGSALEAARAGDIVVVTIPLKNYRQVPVEPLAGKVVIDTNNYYPERDGHIRELDDESTTTSELLQAHLPKSRVVKAFNHIYAAELTTDGQPAGSRNRRALVIAGDDPAAKCSDARRDHFEVARIARETVQANHRQTRHRQKWRVVARVNRQAVDRLDDAFFKAANGRMRASVHDQSPRQSCVSCGVASMLVTAGTARKRADQSVPVAGVQARTTTSPRTVK